jgi:hypothetical protein
MAKAKAKSGLRRAPAKRRPRKAKPGTRGLVPAQARLESLSGAGQEAAERIERVGGHLLGFYNDPLGNQPVLVAILPIESVERVAAVIAKLKARGFVSPYLRAFVVARINPLRWIQGEPPPLEDVLKTMRERAGKFNADKVKQEDLASAGGAPDESD